MGLTVLKRKDANLKLAQGWKQSKRFPWHELFKSLNETDVKPEHLYLLTATFEETGSVKFSGKVRNSEYNKEFRKELEELPYLRNVEPGPVSQSRDGKNMDDFSVKAQLVKTAK